MMMKDNLRKIWKSHLEGNENVKFSRIVELKSLECFIGTILSNKAKFFMLTLDSNKKISSNYLKRFLGVEIKILSFNDKKRLTIILLETELSEIFTVFIEDIIKSLLNIESQKEALSIISKKIDYWRKLFSQYSNELLNSERQRGLYGELYFLSLLLKDKEDYTNIIDSWRAPLGTNQDFYFGNNAIEIKTSISNSNIIKISNEYQLDCAGLDNLWLIFYQIIEIPNNKNTLYNIILKIREKISISHESLLNFDLKLSKLGINELQEKEYNKIGYIIKNDLFYNVINGFPRITKQLIMGGVSQVSYSINISNCEKFKTNYNNILLTIKNEVK